MKMMTLLFVVLIFLFGCAEDKEEFETKENINSQLTIKMENENGVYKIPCKVNGTPMKFIFDTGASIVMISATEAMFLAKQGLLDDNDVEGPITLSIANGSSVNGLQITLKEFEVGGIVLKEVEATISESLSAPLLMGQTVLARLGPYKIDGDEFIILSKSDTRSTSILDYRDSRYQINKWWKIAVVLIFVIAALLLIFGFDGETFPVIFGLSIAVSIIYFVFNSTLLYTTIPDFCKAMANNKYKSAYDLEEEGKYEEALKEIDKAIDYYPENSDAFNLRGCIRDGLNDYHGAIRDYTTCIKLEPNHKYAYLNRCRIKIKLNNYGGAMIDIDHAIRTDSSNQNFGQRAWLKNITYDYKTNDYDHNGALSDINHAIKLDSEKSYDYYLRGAIYEDLGQNNKAIDDFNTAYKMANSNDKQAEYLYRIANIKYDTRDYKKCVELCKIIANIPQNNFSKYKDLLKLAKKRI